MPLGNPETWLCGYLLNKSLDDCCLSNPWLTCNEDHLPFTG
jgi:hypothetical protein